MGYTPVKNFLRRHMQHPRLYAYARRVLLVGQYLLHIPDEPDFKIFSAFRQRSGGTLVDVGANGGQSAIAFAFICPKFKIISFEPNPSLWPELEFVKWLVGRRRFTCHRHGLGDRDSEMVLHVPMLGRLPITTRASLRDDSANEHIKGLEKETGKTIGVKEIRVSIKRFDDLDILPDAIKIDVEGFELSVLQGMVRTIEACHPFFMLEHNDESELCKEFLCQYGYRIYEYDVSSRQNERQILLIQ